MTMLSMIRRRRFLSSWTLTPNYQFITASACFPKSLKKVSGSSSRSELSSSKVGASGLFSSNKEWFAQSCGEDSFMMRSDVIGVADGVGGWPAGSKANPALYARLLLDNIGSYMAGLDDPNNLDLSEGDLMGVSAEELLRRAYQAMDPAVIGSTTVSLAFLQSPWIQFGVLGDCGFMVFRRNGIYLRSEEQQHSFNYPYQLSSKRINRPEDALRLRIRIEPGDLVLLGSDGLFDNLFDEDICAAVRSSLITNPIGQVTLDSVSNNNGKDSSPFIVKYQFATPTRQKLQALADELAKKAREASRDQNYHSPFAKRAIEQGIYAIGGKEDDITVVLAYVAVAEDSPDRRL